MLKSPEKDLLCNWKIFLKSKPDEYQFVRIGLTYLEYILESLFSYKKNIVFLDNYIEDDIFQNIIISHVTHDIYPLVVRVCIYEMHEAKKNGYLTADNSKSRFYQFIDLLCEKSNLSLFFEKYPVLTSLLNTYKNNYCDFIKEFLSNINKDYITLKNDFIFIKNEKLINLEKAGDKHKNGKTVLIITLANTAHKEIKVVYKPRSLACDVAFNNFVIWINSHNIVDLRYVKTINKELYGWCEFIKYEPSQQREKIADFYERLGAVLCIAHILNAGDLHYENLIAVGAYPVIIDHECLIMPTPKSRMPESSQNVYRTILDTLILPNNIFVEGEDEVYDISAFGGGGDQVYPEETLVIKESGTDNMYVVREKVKLKKQKNIPFTTEEFTVSDFYQSFIDGFEALYNLIIKNKCYLLGEASPIHLFKNVEIRLLFRPTSNYGRLLYESLHPILLNDIQKKHEHFNWLDEILKNKSNVNYESIIKSEKEDLYKFDIPLFSHLSTSNFVSDSKGRIIDNCLLKNSYDSLIDKLKIIGTDDLDNQSLLLKQNLFAHSVNTYKGYNEKTSIGPLSYNFSDNSTIKIKNKIIDILDNITRKMIVNDRYFYWSYVAPSHGDNWSVRLTNFDLYDGILGIALTYAYAGKYITPKFNKIALTLFEQIWNYISNISRMPKYGLFSGLGAYLVLITRLAELKLIDNPYEKLLVIINLFENNFKLDEVEYDLTSGIAGYIVSLNVAKKYLPKDIYINQIRACLSHFFEMCPDPQKIPNPKNTPHSQDTIIDLGVAHGISGMACALLSCSDREFQSKIDQWINCVINIRKKYFSKKEKNWPDTINLSKTTDQQSLKYSYSWCHGLLGNYFFDYYYGLKKGKANQALVNKNRSHLANLVKKSFVGVYNICHGDLGLIDVLLESESVNYLPKEFTLKNINHYIVPRLDDMNAIETEHIGVVFIPGLMTGQAGIAYQLMRVMHPEVPSLLLPV